MKKELISVIIPIYNVEKYLNRCIDSIINQTYTNLEIVLVDDGSTDSSWDICKEYENKDKRVKAFRKENSGISATRNFALDHTTGKYIFFIDSDDFIDLDLIEKLYESLLRNNCDFTMANRVNYFDNGIQFCRFSKCGEKSFTRIEALEEMNLYEFFDMSFCGKVIKKELFDGIRFPDGKLCEDFYEMYKVLNKINKIVYVSDTYYYYLQRPGSITKKPKINWDFVYAAKEQEKFILEKYPSLKMCASSAVASSYLTVYDSNFLYKGSIANSELKIMRKDVRSRLKDIIKYNRLSMKKKMQLVLFSYTLPLYNILYKIYKKNEERFF